MTIPPQELSRHGIGASEAAAILGLNPYYGPITIWERKVAELDGAPASDVPDNDAIRWGHLLEQPIRQAYAERFGVTVGVPRRSMFREDAPWRRATPDGLVLDDRSGDPIHGLEIKTASLRLEHHWGEDGTDEVPQHYLVQCAWSMHVAELPRWDLAALIGGQDFRCYRIERDAELEGQIVEAVDRFWTDHVIARRPPPVDASEEFTDYLVRRWTSVRDELLDPTPEVEQLISQIREVRALTRHVAGQKRKLENELRELIADKQGVLSREHGKILCRPQQGRTMTDWEAIAHALAAEFDAGPKLAALVEGNTKRARPCRPLRYPRTWGDADSADSAAS